MIKKIITLTLKQHFRSRNSLSQHCWDALLSSRLSNVGVQGELTTINNIGRDWRGDRQKKRKEKRSVEASQLILFETVASSEPATI